MIANAVNFNPRRIEESFKYPMTLIEERGKEVLLKFNKPRLKSVAVIIGVIAIL